MQLNRPILFTLHLLIALLLSGCSTWPFNWMLGEEEMQKQAELKTGNTEPDPNQPLPERDARSLDLGPTILPGTLSLSEKKLLDIIMSEKATLWELEADPTRFTYAEAHRMALQVILEYETFINRNEDYEYGYIFYGKLLRRLGAFDKANKLFLKANKINPNHAVVKQQIGNYLAEKGIYELALPYFLSAIELSPDEPIYHYQLGELLYTFREDYIKDEIFTTATLDRQMITAFAKAHKLAPHNRDLHQRYAEAFYDLKKPEWDQALTLWHELFSTADSPLKKDIIRLHMSRVQMERGQLDDAQHFANMVTQEGLNANKAKLLQAIEEKQKDANGTL